MLILYLVGMTHSSPGHRKIKEQKLALATAWSESKRPVFVWMEAVEETGSGGCTAACSYVPGLISFRISGCICMGKSLFAPGLDEALFHRKSHFTALLCMILRII